MEIVTDLFKLLRMTMSTSWTWTMTGNSIL